MATEKTHDSIWALVHAVTYTLPFTLITHSFAALAVILLSHFVIDRWRLVRYVVWFKNWWFGGNWSAPGWWKVTATGYPDDTPPWLAVWLMIIADNTIHVLINGASIRWL